MITVFDGYSCVGCAGGTFGSSGPFGSGTSSGSPFGQSSFGSGAFSSGAAGAGTTGFGLGSGEAFLFSCQLSIL